jgi:hypothetical protein
MPTRDRITSLAQMLRQTDRVKIFRLLHHVFLQTIRTMPN